MRILRIFGILSSENRLVFGREVTGKAMAGWMLGGLRFCITGCRVCKRDQIASGSHIFSGQPIYIRERGGDVMEKGEEILGIFSVRIRKILEKAELDFASLQEVRMRAGQPLVCRDCREERFFSQEGNDGYFCVSKEDLEETLSHVSRYSLYAFEEELKQGYLTIPGGHRVGIAGKIVMEEGKICSIQNISFLNVRISHEQIGCADPVLPFLVKGNQFCHTLIISPPRCGKTTLLRDIIRKISNGTGKLRGQNVGVVDERSEIGGSYRGIPQNDLGIRTDVLDCCPKSEGMMMLIRSMAPDVIAVDEIGDYRDSQAIEAVFHCGCKLLATVHGSSVEDIRRKPLLQRLMQYHCFERYVVLDGQKKAGHIREIFDGRGTRLYGQGQKGYLPGMKAENLEERGRSFPVSPGPLSWEVFHGEI